MNYRSRLVRIKKKTRLKNGAVVSSSLGGRDFRRAVLFSGTRPDSEEVIMKAYPPPLGALLP